MRFGLEPILDPIWHAEATLDDLLTDPAARLLMESDGVDEAGLRELASAVGERLDGRALPSPRAGTPPVCVC